jgi:hypothetical protein
MNPIRSIRRSSDYSVWWLLVPAVFVAALIIAVVSPSGADAPSHAIPASAPGAEEPMFVEATGA